MNQPVYLSTDCPRVYGSRKTADLCREYQNLWQWACANPHKLDDVEDGEGLGIYMRLLQCEQRLLERYTANEIVAMRN
jgi:hypothetical protein